MSYTWRLEPDADPASVGVDPAGLDRMAASFEQAVTEGALFGGAQVAVYVKGKRVLDMGGGVARRRTETEVAPDTMFVIFSCTKSLAALAMLMLYERGRFHYDEPVVTYWPSFADEVPEKRSVTIRQVMGHRGGFPAGPSWLTARYWPDRDAIRRAMEEVPLAWMPGKRNGYHAMNFGHVVNELVERIDGRDLGRFLAEEVTGPLGLGDLYVGLPDDPRLEERVAWIERSMGVSSPSAATGVTAGRGSASTGAGAPPRQTARTREPETRHAETPELSNPFNRPEIHRSVLPAAGGIATARDLARLHAALALGGTLDGVELVSPEGLRHCTTPTNRPGDVDETLRMPVRWGTGWHMGGMGQGSTVHTFGHGGMGGQVAFADPGRELAFAFTTTGQLQDTDFLTWRLGLQSGAFAACGT